MQREGHQPGAGRQDVQTKLFGNFITQRRRAQTRHGETARGDHHFFRCDRHAVQFQGKPFVITRNAEHFAAQAHRHVALCAFRHQHIDNLLRRVVAEQLAERLFMPGDAVFAHQIDKVPLGVTRQRRFAEMGVLAQIGSRFDIQIREVAAPAAGHQDLTPRFFTIIDEQHAATRLTGLRRTEHTRRASAYNNGIKPFHFAILSENRA